MHKIAAVLSVACESFNNKGGKKHFLEDLSMYFNHSAVLQWQDQKHFQQPVKLHEFSIQLDMTRRSQFPVELLSEK